MMSKTMTAEAVNIDVTELRGILEDGKPVTVLDVRSAADRAEWSIPGSMHVDAYETLKAGDPDALSGLELPIGTPVVTVCGAGNTSLVAAEQLRARGLNARSLAGGMKAWSLAWNTAEVPLRLPSARVIQVRRTGKGCLSYLVGDGGEAAIIDPSLDPDIYVDLAARNGWTINRILDTHVHADHLSRARALSEQTGATLYLPKTSEVTYPFVPLWDEDVLVIGKSSLVALSTPGHTAESMSYLLNGRALFTGDTLFHNGVGRPDLEASADGARERARMLWLSLQGLAALESGTLVLPGHSSAPIPFDEVPIAATLQEVIEHLSALQLPEDEFVEAILGRLPATPPNYDAIKRFNESGELPKEDPTELEAGANRCAVT